MGGRPGRAGGIAGAAVLAVGALLVHAVGGEAQERGPRAPAAAPAEAAGAVLPTPAAGAVSPNSAADAAERASPAGAAAHASALRPALPPGWRDFSAGRVPDGVGRNDRVAGGHGFTESEGRPGPAAAALASAVLPGAGQWLLGQRRWMAYLAVESVLLLEHARRRSDGRGLRRDYRDLAWNVARAPITEGPRVDGTFEYYEALTRYARSGAFDRTPGAPGVQPETDPDTFNGAVWALARQLFMSGDLAEDPDEDAPGYGLALEFYLARGYPPEMSWDWSGSAEEQVRFGRLIRESDDALRRATLALGFVIGNHVLSAFDALVAAGLRQGGLEDVEVELRLTPRGHAGGIRDGLHQAHTINPGAWALTARVYY